jgi:hypothetical protein
VPNQRAITEYETATAGIPDSFDCLTGETIRELAHYASGLPNGAHPAAEANKFARAHFDMLATWYDHLDQLDSEIRADVIEGGIPDDDRDYLKQQARALFAAQQTLLRAVAEYHHGTAGPSLHEGYGWAYQMSNSILSPL